MRMHTKLLNLTNEQIEKTVEKAHALGKQVYVTAKLRIDHLLAKYPEDLS